MTTPAVEFHDLSKAFFGTPVLKNVTLAAQSGRALGLVGENGAGKSTLIGVLGGIVQADSGEMRLGGQLYRPKRPADALSAGIAIVHQELNLFSNLSIGENLFLANFPRRRWLPWINRRELHRRSREILSAVDLGNDPSESVANLSPGERQLVEIARALDEQARVIVFDEPTTSLTAPEAKRLFAIIDRLRRTGVAVIFISHGLGDVLRLCDDVAVLRDGHVAACGSAAQFSIPSLVSAMVGRDIDQVFPTRSCRPESESVLEVRALCRTGLFDRVSLSVRRGEILGISGLMGSGRTELARVLFGLDRADSGEVIVDGKPLRGHSPREAIRRGLAFLTEDRREEGLLPDSSVQENVALPSLRDISSRFTRRVDRGALAQMGRESAAATAIRCRDLDRQPVRTLSGGNQQKVVFAKWLRRRPQVVLLDEPTRGVDVGAKFEIYRLVDALAAGGAGVLLISSEIEELIGLCDRILVLSRGQITGEFSRDLFDREVILRAAFGEDRLQ